MCQFNREMMLVDDIDEKVALTTPTRGMRSSKFVISLTENPSTSMAEFMSKGQKFMNAEDTMSTQKGQDQGESSQPSKKRIESESARP
jgi:hypothetical protein